MKVIKQKVLRKISLKYEDFHKIFNLPSERDFTMMMDGAGFKIWKNDQFNLIDWEVEIPYEEMEKNIGLLKDEKIIGEDYWVFQGYSLIIETNKENLNRIKNRLIQKRVRRYFRLQTNPKEVLFREWKRVRNIGGRSK